MSNPHPRNRAGCVDTSDCYRTIDGERYVGWLAGNATDERAAKYRAAGIKCRRIGDELFLRESDQDAAANLDRMGDAS